MSKEQALNGRLKKYRSMYALWVGIGRKLEDPVWKTEQKAKQHAGLGRYLVKEGNEIRGFASIPSTYIVINTSL